MPKQLNNGAITLALQRAFGFKGRYIPMLDEVIVPVYVIADPSPSLPTRLCAATDDQAGDGTNLQFIQLFNPVGSGVVVNVTNVSAISEVKEQLLIAFYDGDASIQGADIHFRDRRISGNPTTIVRTDIGGLAPVGERVAVLEVDGALAQTAAWDTQASDPRQPLAVLTAGQGLIVQPRGVVPSSIITVNFRFLEIPQTEVSPPGGLPG